MNLIIDQGNSFTKIAIFKGKMIVHLSEIKSDDYKSIILKVQKIINEGNSVEKIIFSGVSSENTEIKNKLSDIAYVINFTNETAVPIKNLYKTPETLGRDRLAAAIGANNIFPDTNVLIFDSGTALTIDFVNNKNEYEGGNISPGISMRFNALHSFTNRLPKIEQDFNYNKLTGKTTQDAILSGVQNGILYETERYIENYTGKYDDLKVIFTGGDYTFFEKSLEHKIYTDPYLVLKGLNLILNYNAK